jgi:hypothetical protein
MLLIFLTLGVLAAAFYLINSPLELPITVPWYGELDSTAVAVILVVVIGLIVLGSYSSRSR